MKSITLISVALLYSHLALARDADREVVTATSPSKAFVARVREVPDEAFAQRRDLDGVRVIILRQGGDGRGGEYARHEIPRRLVSHMAWSPDSRFLVITTTSSGGHSAWHFPAYVFCVADKSLRPLDDVIGNVTSPEFHFEPPNVLVASVQAGEDSKTRKIALAKVPSLTKPMK